MARLFPASRRIGGRRRASSQCLLDPTYVHRPPVRLPRTHLPSPLSVVPHPRPGYPDGMYELFEHTADLGLRAAAPDLDTLFAEAATCLFTAVVEDPSTVRPTTEVRI